MILYDSVLICPSYFQSSSRFLSFFPSRPLQETGLMTSLGTCLSQAFWEIHGVLGNPGGFFLGSDRTTWEIVHRVSMFEYGRSCLFWVFQSPVYLVNLSMNHIVRDRFITFLDMCDVGSETRASNWTPVFCVWFTEESVKIPDSPSHVS